MTDFVPFEKIPRLNRDIVVTEKIDGTNACIDIRDVELVADIGHIIDAWPAEDGTGRTLALRAGSRTRWLRATTKDGDNYGFAKWVEAHATQLRALGEGLHFGEWWGHGIQRGYGLDHKRFSLFNVARWGAERPSCCDVVPVLYEGAFGEDHIRACLRLLKWAGSVASSTLGPDCEGQVAEGVIVFHTASRQLFKVTLENDGVPKMKAMPPMLGETGADVQAPEHRSAVTRIFGTQENHHV